MRGSLVGAVNGLTARWARALDDGSTVLTAAGVWPLLALLAHGAGGPARTELAGVLSVPAERAAADARSLLGALRSFPGVCGAIGLWTRADLPLEPDWSAALPAGSHGVLTGDPLRDAPELDRWAGRESGGRIASMPIRTDEDTLLVLASALTVRTDWIRPFDAFPTDIAEGPWRGRRVAALARTTGLLDRVGLARTPDGPLTVLHVLGTRGVDVHLLLGEEGRRPGSVLAAGIAALARRDALLPGSLLPPGEAGPGLLVRRVLSVEPEPRLHARLAAFTVTARHDLLARPELFGLTAATGLTDGHFPGISAVPTAVTRAAQSATAAFGPHGFRSAAVTAIGSGAGAGVPSRLYRVKGIDVRFDRPFGFLAVHRTSRLVLDAGWVAEPQDRP